MRLCVFEDAAIKLLEPLTLTRPAFDVLCGASSLLEKQIRAADATEVAALVRPELADLCRIRHPNLIVNDLAWLGKAATVFVNARWLPGTFNVHQPCIGLARDQIAFAVLPAGVSFELARSIEDELDVWRGRLPCVEAGGTLFEYAWDVVERNPEALRQDVHEFRRSHGVMSTHALQIVGPPEDVVIAADVTIDPFVVADTRKGPVMIAHGAIVHPFSYLEGPCYIGPRTQIFGAKLRGGTLGVECRIGGEVEESIVHGYSNKYHDGFLGHSYVGEWVNLAAGTQVSDLRNDYGQIRPIVDGRPVKSGLNKLGTFIGDHTKTGLNTLINCGTMIGAFCNLLPTGTYAPPVIPSFCQARNGQIVERLDLRQLFTTADYVLRRRGREWTQAHSEYFFALYEQTRTERHNAIRETEHRRLRRSAL